MKRRQVIFRARLYYLVTMTILLASLFQVFMSVFVPSPAVADRWLAGGIVFMFIGVAMTLLPWVSVWRMKRRVRDCPVHGDQVRG